MHKIDFLHMYQTLIATPSVSALQPSLDQSNLTVINHLATWLEQLGFEIEITELDSAPGKFNLLARIGSLKSGGGLMLAGHTDTVPFDESRWNNDPFKLTEKDGRLYGLGSIDMKGFFAFVIDALQDRDLSQLKKPLYILATADEETTMAGAQEIARHPDLKPDYCVIGEPTDMVPVFMHKGHLSTSIRITGRSGHSSVPEYGLNAIQLMHKVIGNLLALQVQLKQDYNNAYFDVPYPTVNLGHIHGGDNANRICGCCDLHIDIRPLPGLSITELEALILKAVAPINQQHPGSVEVTQLHDPIPAFSGTVDSGLVKLAESISETPAVAVNYCTEAPFLQQLGCETLVMGPGSIAQAHQPDEYLDMKQIKPTMEKLGKLIDQLCF